MIRRTDVDRKAGAEGAIQKERGGKCFPGTESSHNTSQHEHYRNSKKASMVGGREQGCGWCEQNLGREVGARSCRAQSAIPRASAMSAVLLLSTTVTAKIL